MGLGNTLQLTKMAVAVMAARKLRAGLYLDRASAVVTTVALVYLCLTVQPQTQ
jgi:hypothetical protein